jgi:hypothetical protein
MRMPNADFPERTGSEKLGARLWHEKSARKFVKCSRTAASVGFGLRSKPLGLDRGFYRGSVV